MKEKKKLCIFIYIKDKIYISTYIHTYTYSYGSIIICVYIFKKIIYTFPKKQEKKNFFLLYILNAFNHSHIFLFQTNNLILFLTIRYIFSAFYINEWSILSIKYKRSSRDSCIPSTNDDFIRIVRFNILNWKIGES